MKEMVCSSAHPFGQIALVLILSLLKCCSLADATGALTFELPDNDKMCFYETFKGSAKYTLEYQVIKGGNNDVDVLLKSPNGKILYHAEKSHAEDFDFETSKGTFEVCFSNEFSTVTHKTVYFAFAAYDIESLAAIAGNNEPTANTQLEESMEEIHRSSARIISYQQDYRLWEARDRYQADELSDRVQWWSIGQGLVIMFTGVSQVLILKTFFSDKRVPSNTGT